MEIECKVYCLSHPAAMRRQIGTKNCFGLRSKAPFVTAQFRPNSPWLWWMGTEYHVWCCSHLAAMTGEIRTKICFSLKSKVPFVKRRFRPNFQWLWRTRKECQVWRCSQPAANRAEIEKRNPFLLSGEVPFVKARFRQNVQWEWCMKSAMCDVWATLLQWEARMDDKLSDSRLSAFRYTPISTKPAVVIAHEVRVPRVMLESSHCNARRDKRLKCFGLKNKVPFVSDRFRPNLHWFWRMRKECHVWCLRNPAAMRSERGTRNCLGFKNKVPFITDRFRPNVHCLWRKRRVCQMCCVSHPAAMRDRDEKMYRPQESSALHYCPISTKLATVVAHGEWVPHVSVSHPASRWGETGMKNCFVLKSKLPFVMAP
jgi:hypothetical protein